MAGISPFERNAMSEIAPPTYPAPPFEQQQQAYPGRTDAMQPRPDHGEQSYQGAGKLKGKTALITGADSGIGRAVAIAFAREGADVLIAYWQEKDDAEETARWVEQAGRRAVLMAGDVADPAHCQALVDQAVAQFGHIDIIVNNAAFQKGADSIDDISVEDWQRHFDVNLHSMFYMVKAAMPHLKRGASIINTASINGKSPKPRQLAYSATKAAIMNFTANLAQLLAEKGIRANAVLPGPIWTPLITSTMEPEEITSFGEQVPMKRPGQPAELAPSYVLLASDQASYMTGAMIAVTGGAVFI
jgi:NAD(P)-dependent dehydrogenase (short-subunit alcohol dehydrogenase family)